MAVNMNPLSIFLVGFLAVSVSCIPKFDDGGFKPSSIDYTDKSAKVQDQMAVPSHPKSRSDSDPSKSGNELTDRTQEPRFGFTNVGDSTGYGVSSYAPARIDLGGLLLGAVIGIGTILVIPKLLYVLSGSYGAYARSDDGGIAQVMTKLDDALARHGVDTTTCMQRVACSYSRQAAEAVREGGPAGSEISSVDKLVDALATNQMMRTALQGTAVQEALEAGRKGQNCARLYRQCGLSAETMLSILAKLAAGTAAAAPKTASTA